MQCLRIGPVIHLRKLGVSPRLRNPYTILGVSPGASKKEVKNAYRNKVKQCHPDLHPDDSAKAAEFRKVQEAYESVLSGAAKQSTSRSSRKRPFTAQTEEENGYYDEGGKWNPGMDFEAQWRQRMKIRQEYEKRAKAAKDRESKEFRDSKIYQRARYVHHNLNKMNDKYDYDPEVVEEIRRMRRKEYEDFMKRRNSAKRVDPHGIRKFILSLVTFCCLCSSLTIIYQERERQSVEQLARNDAQLRSMIAWNNQTRDVMRDRMAKQRELVTENDLDQLDDQNRAILEKLEQSSEALRSSEIYKKRF